MASFNQFNIFNTDLANGVHDLDDDDVEVYLTDATPDQAAHEVKADLAEITQENGYTGPESVTPVLTQDGAAVDLTGTDVTITASGGSIGPFRYVVLFNNTPASPTDPLIGYWDNGSSITLSDGESFTTDFAPEGADEILTVDVGTP